MTPGDWEVSTGEAYPYPLSASDRDFQYRFEIFATEESGGTPIFIGGAPTGDYASDNDWYWPIDNVCLLIDADPINAVEGDWQLYE